MEYQTKITLQKPISYTLSKDRFSLLAPLVLTYISDVSEHDGFSKLCFSPPGCNDIQILEGVLERIRCTVLNEEGKLVDAWAYHVNQQVFLLSLDDIDEWLVKQIEINEAICEFTQVSGTPCWLSLDTFWKHIYSILTVPIELQLVDFYGHLRLRYAHYGRTVMRDDFIKQ